MSLASLTVNSTLTCLVFYLVYGAFYRLYLSPIAKFPGRKLAALTLWYEFYYDVVKRGSYVWEIQKMHEQYGPIVRINPYELHVADADPDFMTRLYPNVAKNVEKWSWSAGMFGSTDMTFGTVGHTLHRLRRGAFSAFFSKTSIRRLEPVIQSIINTLCEKLTETMNTGVPVNMVYAYSALTQDIITEYCFAKCRNVLHMEDFSPWYYKLIDEPAELTHTIKQFPQLVPIMDLVPDSWMRIMSPLVAQLRDLQAGYVSQVQSILSNHEDKASTSHNTIFHSLRDDPDLPLREKSLRRLVMEAQSLVGAGTVSTTHMLSETTFHVLSNREVFDRLMAELEVAIPNAINSVSWHDVEKLPYLSAVIKEGLRTSYGSIHRLQRVHPETALTFRDWTIPPGTPVGMSSLFLHNNPEVFPEPKKFDPLRWIGPEGDKRQKHLFNFGRGTRQCAGMNLAYAEIYMVLATVFRRLGPKMRLYDTIRERDVDIKHDFFLTNPSLESKGVRITFGESGVIGE